MVVKDYILLTVFLNYFLCHLQNWPESEQPKKSQQNLVPDHHGHPVSHGEPDDRVESSSSEGDGHAVVVVVAIGRALLGGHIYMTSAVHGGRGSPKSRQQE